MLNDSALSFIIKCIKQKYLQVTQGFLLFYGKLILPFPPDKEQLCFFDIFNVANF